MNNIDEDDVFRLDFKVISHHQTRDNMLKQSMIANPKLYQTKFVNNKVVVPSSLVVSWYHDNLNHPGIQRTFETINMHFTCKGLRRIVESHVSSCAISAKQKRSNKQYGLIPPSGAVYKPWECVHIGLFGPWSFECSDGKPRQIQAVFIIDSCLRWI